MYKVRLKQQGAAGKSTECIKADSTRPRPSFAGLSITIRGHSHPTVKELEKQGEARPQPHTTAAAAAITGLHIKAQTDQKSPS